MSIAANIYPSYDPFDLSTVRFYDCSTFALPDAPSRVHAISFLFASIESLANIQTDVTDLEAFRQYKITAGTPTINGVTYAVDDIVLFAGDHTLTGTDTAEQTGYYSAGYVANFYATPHYAAYTPTQMGDSETDLAFADAIRFLKYQIFNTQYLAGTISVSGSTTFIVKGTQGNYITISGASYYVGEQFTKDADFTFADGSGTNYVVEFEDEVDIWYPTYKNSYSIYHDYIQNYATTTCTQELIANLLKVHSLLNAVTLASDKDFDIDTTAFQNYLDEINNYYALKGNKAC